MSAMTREERNFVLRNTLFAEEKLYDANHDYEKARAYVGHPARDRTLARIGRIALRLDDLLRSEATPPEGAVAERKTEGGSND